MNIKALPATCELCGKWLPGHSNACPRNGVHPSQWKTFAPVGQQQEDRFVDCLLEKLDLDDGMTFRRLDSDSDDMYPNVKCLSQTYLYSS